MDNHVWPTIIQNLPWPEVGLTYSYENRGYIKPEKVRLWLSKAFGEGNAKSAVSCPSVMEINLVYLHKMLHVLLRSAVHGLCLANTYITSGI